MQKLLTRSVLFVWVFCCVLISTGQTQTPSGLSIARNGGPMVLSWSNVTVSALYSNFYGQILLQSGTNLLRPIQWQDMGFIGGTVGQTNLAADENQKFFRVSPVLPLFKYAVFYDLDLEMNPGTPMYIKGRVHSNKNIWATGLSLGALLSLQNIVDAVGTISNLPSPLDPLNTGNRFGYVLFSSQPDPFSENLTIRLTNFLTAMQLPPAAYSPPNYSAAYSINGMSYLKNAVDLVITNAANGTNGTRGTNIIVFYQNPNNSPNFLTPVLPDMVLQTNITGSGSSTTTNVLYTYSFVTNVSFYDYRESKVVQAVQIDVARLNVWLTNASALGGFQYDLLNIGGATSKGHKINSIYVFNNVPMKATQLPGVRMVNGSLLPSAGLTVATPDPLYVKGDYNTTTNGTIFSKPGNATNTFPAALLCDAITILSANWSDGFNSATSLSARICVSTSVNAAICSGIVPSNGQHYSGGVENYFRLLESWSGPNFTWNGSVTAMFASQWATNSWQPAGNYYDPPIPSWDFDQNFMNPSRLPPLTPTVANYVTP